jgi:hypothetical protein
MRTYHAPMSERFESLKPHATGAAEPSYVADIWSAKNRGAFAGLSRGYGGTEKGLIHQVGISIEPCTPPGMDPLKDPANPKSPNYDAKEYGPRPSAEIPLIPKDGVVRPQDLELQKKLGPRYSAEYGAYQGMCNLPPPEPDPNEDKSKIPVG